MCAFDQGVCVCMPVCGARTRLCKYINNVRMCWYGIHEYICISVSNYKVHLFFIVREWYAVTSYLTHRV